MKIISKNIIASYLVNEILKKYVFKFLSDKHFIILDYLITRKEFPNIKNPKTFSEKLQWIKIYGDLEKYSKFVDKFEARDYISKTIGNEYLVPLIGVWDRFDEIQLNNIPNQFVIKASHGQNYIYICKNKNLEDLKILENDVNVWINENYYKKTREIQYKQCKPKIICEKYLENESGELIDYKIFCFNGKPRLIEVHTGRLAEHKADYMNLNWKKLPISNEWGPNSDLKIEKPKKLKTMLEIAEKLSKPFNFVRVDLYYVKDRIYFGELTFTPGNGLCKFYPPETDSKLGKLINL
jgi:hypothetical protein